MDSYPFVFGSILLGDFERPIRTAIIDDCIIPILMGLSQYALDAFVKIWLPVKNRGDHADEGFMF